MSPGSKTRVFSQRQRCTSLPGVQIFRLKRVEDPRGNLCAGEFRREIPFQPRRFFMVYEVPARGHRGGHAHKRCHQFLIALSGKMSIQLSDGTRRLKLTLRPRVYGVYVPPGIWLTQSGYTRDGVLLVLASHHYDEADYIRDLASYQRWRSGRRPLRPHRR
jgi:dTDP-4-dehydrorhamnose 3,5-epimerase-like enzyme